MPVTGSLECNVLWMTKIKCGQFFGELNVFVVFWFEIKLCQELGQNALFSLVCPGLKKQLAIFTINETVEIINYFYLILTIICDYFFK